MAALTLEGGNSMSKTGVNILCLVAFFLGVNLKVQAQSSSLTGKMNAARVQPTASLLNNGEVLVTGAEQATGRIPPPSFTIPHTERLATRGA
jgi:hypothetical protein